MLFNPQTGERIVHRMPIPDRPHDYWEDVSEWPDSIDDSGPILGYLYADKPMEHHSFKHHLAVLDQEQADAADDNYERWLAYTLNKDKIEKRREAARARAAKRRERPKVGEFASVVNTQNEPVQKVFASRVSTSVNEKLQNIEKAYSMFRDGALSSQEFEELKREILAS